ncbi:cell division protein FtsQ/DivIB [Propionibacteriaceae bacterium G57]|uniref:cell division protein FtsQ/DivIB n=1 Tax=Aestuariimicrobium sp. G57 TaxID=3418485 RepID=UPI003DA6E70E
MSPAGRQGRLPAGIADAGIARQRKRQQARRRVLVRGAIAAGIAVLLAVAVWLVGFSPVLSATSVEVEGTDVTTVAGVRGQARVPMRTPLIRVNTDDIATRVAAMPAVESVRVERRWPNTIAILVTERTPVLQRRVGGTFYWSDAKGVVFHQATKARAGLVVVEAPDDRRLLTDLATVQASLTPALRSRVQKITATSPDNITLVLDKGQTVIWGSSAQSTTKAQVATAMLGVKATVYDVSSPANPTSR